MEINIEIGKKMNQGIFFLKFIVILPVICENSYEVTNKVH